MSTKTRWGPFIRQIKSSVDVRRITRGGEGRARSSRENLNLVPPVAKRLDDLCTRDLITTENIRGI